MPKQGAAGIGQSSAVRSISQPTLEVFQPRLEFDPLNTLQRLVCAAFCNYHSGRLIVCKQTL